MTDDNKRLRKSSKKADQTPGKEKLRQRKDKDRNSNKNNKPDNNIDEMSAEEIEILVHDLEVRNEELLRAQSELSQTRNRYRQLYEFAPVGYLTVDKGGTIREANRTAGTICGWKREQIVKARLEQLIHHDHHNTCWRLLRQASMENSATAELRVVSPDQHECWMHVTVSLQPAFANTEKEYFIALDDISERKQLEQSLTRERELLQRLVDKIPAMLVWWDPDLKNFAINAHVTEVLGWTREDAEQSDFMDKVFPDLEYRKKAVEQMQDLSGDWNDLICTAKNGTQVPTAWANIQLSERRMVGIGMDLSERKKYEENLLKIQQELEKRVNERTAESRKRAKTLQQLAMQLSRTEQQERNRLGTLLHDDLQQFLAAAIFPLEILEEQIESSEQRAAVDKTKKLVQQAMEKARTLSHELAPPVSKQCDLSECLQWCSEWARENFDLEVDVNIEASAPELSNETKIFLLNSVRELLFNIHKHADIRQAEIYMQKIHEMLCIRVLDHGRGGDFDVNENSSDNGGYGLFNINERLKALGGFMTVESEPNDGTQVCLYVKSSL